MSKWKVETEGDNARRFGAVVVEESCVKAEEYLVEKQAGFRDAVRYEAESQGGQRSNRERFELRFNAMQSGPLDHIRLGI